MKYLLKYIPGLIGGSVVAIFFSYNSAQSIILAVLFAGLITLVVALSTELTQAKSRDDEAKERDKDLDNRIDQLAESVGESYNDLSRAVLNDMQELADQMGTEIHELAVMFANHKYGEDEE